MYLKGAGGLSKLVISRVIIRVAPFRALITLLITYLLSPLPLQVGYGTTGVPTVGWVELSGRTHLSLDGFVNIGALIIRVGFL